MNYKFLIGILLSKCLPIYQKCLLFLLRKKKTINITFIAMNLPMWRYQDLYLLLKNNPKFNINVVITPCINYNKDQQIYDCNILINYFKKHNINYYLGIKKDGAYLNIRKELKPDILFYPQPYGSIVPNRYKYSRFMDKLICYYPYAFWTAKGDWCYNQLFHNFAWKLFYSTSYHYEDAKYYAFNKAKNVEIVGYPNADKFLNNKHKDVWKKQSILKKRIIWAPHYTIKTGYALYKSNFLWMADFMLYIADKYKDKIQFAFKPHPRLFTELCNHKEWGKDKAERYYKLWSSMENTQLEEKDYIDLFMTSDAMIHDSQSFMVEYHYTTNPVMYMTKDFEREMNDLSKFGQLAMNHHYIGKNKENIIHFIEEVILKHNDPMKNRRIEFVKNVLTPPNNQTVAQNTLDIIMKELNC